MMERRQDLGLPRETRQQVGILREDHGQDLGRVLRGRAWCRWPLRGPPLSPRQRAMVANDLGLFAKALGDLTKARAAFAYCQSLDVGAADAEIKSTVVQNLALAELVAGRLLQAIGTPE